LQNKAQPVFSERELAISRRPSVYLSVTFVHPTQAIQIFGNILYHTKEHLS